MPQTCDPTNVGQACRRFGNAGKPGLPEAGQ
jgi:hypothetical protein